MERTKEEWLDELAARGFKIGRTAPYGGRRSYAEIRPSALSIRMAEPAPPTHPTSSAAHESCPHRL
jgi:hypothetical protein